MKKSYLVIVFLCSILFVLSSSIAKSNVQEQKFVVQPNESGHRGQMPSKTPFSASRWKRYTQELVAEILKDQPDSVDLVNQINIKIDRRDIVYAGSDVDHKLIEIFYGQIKLIENEDEYVFLLAHELTHIRSKHKDIYILFGWTSRHDIELRRQEELEADEGAYITMRAKGYDICAPLRLANRIMTNFKAAYPHIDHQSTQGILADIFQSRIDAMQKNCANPQREYLTLPARTELRSARSGGFFI